MRSFGDRVRAALFKPNLWAEHTAFSTWIFERYQLTWILLLILAPSGLHSPPDSLTSSLCSLRTLVQLYGSSPSGPGKHSFPFYADPVPSGWEVLPLALPSLLTPCQLIRGLITWKAFFAGSSSPTLARFPLVIQASAIVRGLLSCGHVFFHRLRALEGLMHLTAALLFLTLLAQSLPEYTHNNCFLTEWEHLLSRCKILNNNKKNQVYK